MYIVMRSLFSRMRGGVTHIYMELYVRTVASYSCVRMFCPKAVYSYMRNAPFISSLAETEQVKGDHETFD